MNEFEDNIIMKQINYLNAFLDELCQQGICYEIADRHKVILTENSYEIVKAKYASKRGQKQTRLDFAEREHTRPKVKYTKK